MLILSSLVPTLSLLAIVVVCALPWGLGDSLRFVMPLLPFAVVHYWVRCDRPLPASAVFTAGFLVDVLTFGPLGYWSLVYLIGMALTAGLSWIRPGEGLVSRWRDFALVAVPLAILGWLVGSIYFVTPIEWTPMAFAVAVWIGLYPLVSGFLRPLEVFAQGPQQLNLHRNS